MYEAKERESQRCVAATSGDHDVTDLACPRFGAVRRHGLGEGRVDADNHPTRLEAPEGSLECPSTSGAPLPIEARVSGTVRRLRYPATCSSCGAALARGTEASWDREAKKATCTSCLAARVTAPDVADGAVSATAEKAVAVAIDRGQAGRSAAREWRRRRERREQAVRSRYGRLGGVVLALSDDPHSTASWAYGASGERALGKLLDPLRDEGMAVLHDRRIPGSKANIDHLVVAPWGVFVIDAKNYKGRVEKRDRGGLFSTDYRLYVGGRDRTALIAGMTKQVDAVRKARGDEFANVQICKAICFVEADWPLFARPIELDRVHVCWPGALGKLLRTEGTLSQGEIAQIERRLALAVPAT